MRQFIQKGDNEFPSNSCVILWIQSVPKTGETVLSKNGMQIPSKTSEYIKNFQLLNKASLEKFKDLSATLKRFSCKSDNHRLTYLVGHFVEKDKSDRRICYRALILDANKKEEECSLLAKEADLYGCSISEEDRLAFKKKGFSKLIIVILVLILVIILTWI